MQILQNQIRCKLCQDEPYSAHRHDYKSCKCGAVSVDGGMSYLRRGGDLKVIKEISISIEDDVYDELIEALQRKTTNERGKMCEIFRVLRNGGLLK